MGSDWHPRRHPQPDPNRFPQRTLPSFAELTSSSSDSVLHRPRDSVPPPPPAANTADRPVSQSTPPTTLAALDFANSTQQASFTAINHTSPHVSPTNTRIPPLAPEQQQHHHHQPQRFSLSLPQPTAGPYSPQEVAAPSQPPLIASLRQDSAISQHRFDISKEAEPTVPSSVLAFSYFHPAVGGNGRQPNAPRPISHPAGPASPHSPASEYRSNQPSVETGTRNQNGATSPSSSSNPHTFAESSRSPEQVRDANTDSGSKRPLPSPTLDQTNGSGRHQRYNVRFNTVYTSENMPPNQRPRPDPHPTAPVPVETPEEQPSPEHTIKPSVEQAILAITTAAPPPMEDPAQLQQQNTPQVERCKNCGVRWKRPLPGENQFRLSSPAQNIREQTRLTEDYIKRLENHTKYADEAYAHWVRQHQMCPAAATSPPETEAAHKSRSRSIEDPSPPSPPAHPVSAKRKSEIPHEASKYRKVVTFDPPSNPTPPVRSTAPA
ncbi:hypothetical protein AG0111_0g11116 [Alternaria gaisen]|uniref:Uncharacterized protein n=1 Tax=Alternaria gaisen TaxID=167740 RepID=A0ACB6F866_9PLEO|nr:hypothetical protein AG0111_0g11116 [Alternaria gaisen]